MCIRKGIKNEIWEQDEKKQGLVTSICNDWREREKEKDSAKHGQSGKNWISVGPCPCHQILFTHYCTPFFTHEESSLIVNIPLVRHSNKTTLVIYLMLCTGGL